MNLRELDVAPHPITSSPNSWISDFVFRQAGWMYSENLTVLSNSNSAMSLYTLAVEYWGCCIQLFTWYVCARVPGSLRFTAPNSTWTGGLLMDISNTCVRTITGLCWLNAYVLSSIDNSFTMHFHMYFYKLTTQYRLCYWLGRIYHEVYEAWVSGSLTCPGALNKYTISYLILYL